MQHGNFHNLRCKAPARTISFGTLCLSPYKAPSIHLSRRTAYARTDSTSSIRRSVGEPHHRHIRLRSREQAFIHRNRALNAWKSSPPPAQTRVAQISVPGASSAPTSPPMAQRFGIGTAIEQIVCIDTSSLRIRNRYTLAGLTPPCGNDLQPPALKFFRFQMASLGAAAPARLLGRPFCSVGPHVEI